MTEFEYKALDTQGKEIIDVIEAETQKDAIQKIRNMGYFPCKVKATKRKKKSVTVGSIFEGLKDETLHALSDDDPLTELKAEKARLLAEDRKGVDVREQLEQVQGLIDRFEELEKEKEEEEPDAWEALGEMGKAFKEWFSGESKTDRIEKRLIELVAQQKEIVVQLKEMNKHLDRLPKGLSGETGPG